MKLLVIKLSPASYHFPSLRSKYFPQHAVIKHPQPLRPLGLETKFHIHTHNSRWKDSFISF